MKKLLLAAAAASVFAAAPAFAADSDTEDFDIYASVPATCTISDPGTFEMGPLSINLTAAQASTLSINTSIDKRQDFWVSCNDTNKMTLSSDNNGFLKRDGAAPTAAEAAEGFTDKIGYGVSPYNYLDTGTWQVQPALVTGATFHQGTSRGAIHRNVEMYVRIRTTDQAANTRPLAGDYTDNVTVTVAIAA